MLRTKPKRLVGKRIAQHGGHPSWLRRLAAQGATTAGSMADVVDLGRHLKTGFLGPVYVPAFRPIAMPGDLNCQQIGLDRFQPNQLLGSLDRIRRDIDALMP